jgi:hypothetical protein
MLEQTGRAFLGGEHFRQVLTRHALPRADERFSHTRIDRIALALSFKDWLA